MFLLSAVVFALADDSHTQQIAIKTQAFFCVAHHNGGVINTKEELVRGVVPFFSSLIRRELQNLKRMTIRVFEIESFDSCCVPVPIGEALGRQIFRKLDEFVSELQTHNSHADSEDTFEVFISLAGYFCLANFCEAKHTGIKIHGPIHVGHSYVYRIDGRNEWAGSGSGAGDQACKKQESDRQYLRRARLKTSRHHFLSNYGLRHARFASIRCIFSDWYTQTLLQVISHP